MTEKNKANNKSFQGAEELNMAEFPFCLISGRGDGSRSICYERNTTMADGVIIHMSFTVFGGERGLPTGGDQDIYVALMAAWAVKGFQSKVIEFQSVYNLLKSVGIQPDGYGYERAKNAFERFCGLLCTAEKSWWDVKSRMRKSAIGFHLFESFYLRKAEDDENDGPCHIVASDFLYASVMNGNTKPLDIAMYTALNTPLARRLYRYLDQQRRACRRKQWSVSLIKIQSVLPLNENYYPSQVQRILVEGLQDLEKNRFLLSFQFTENENLERILHVVFFEQVRSMNELTTDEDVRCKAVAKEIAEELNDGANIAYHLKTVKTMPEEYLYRALSETRDAKNRGLIRTTPAQFYVNFLRRNCTE